MIDNNKILKFELSPRNLKVKKLLNQDFLIVEMKAISSANPNRNGSYFTKESMADAIPTFYNKPILSSFNVYKDDFRGHEGELDYDAELDQIYYDYTDENSETPLGMIRSNDKVELVFDETDGLYWIKFTCALWVKYGYKQIKRLLKSKDGKKKISVEIEVINSYVDENGTEVITKFAFDGCTILSDQLETGIENAQLTILDKISDAVFQKKQACLSFAYNNLDSNISNENTEEISMNQKGGEKQMPNEDEKKEVESADFDNLEKKENELEKEVESQEENKEVESQEESKEEESKEENKEVKFQEENKEVESQEENKEKFVASSDNKEENENQEKFEANLNEKDILEKKEVLEFVSIGDEQVNITTLAEKFEELSQVYTTLQKDFSAIQGELDSYKKAEKEANIKSMIEFAQNIVNSENDLTDADKKELNTQIESECSNEKFTSKEEVKTFAISNIAVKLYVQKLKDKPSKKELSISFTHKATNEAENVEEDGITKLQRLSKKLEYI